MDASKVSVLVVDDRPDVRLSLLYMLEASGFAVAEARDGREAIASIARRKTDIVLADFSMPNMGGVELGQYIGARHMTHPKVVLMTGSVRLDPNLPEEEMKKMGADAVLQKPFTREQLVRTIERLLARPSAESSEGPRR